MKHMTISLFRWLTAAALIAIPLCGCKSMNAANDNPQDSAQVSANAGLMHSSLVQKSNAIPLTAADLAEYKQSFNEVSRALAAAVGCSDNQNIDYWAEWSKDPLGQVMLFCEGERNWQPLKQLAASGADLNPYDIQGMTPLHVLVDKYYQYTYGGFDGNINEMRQLTEEYIRLGADITMKSADGKTILMYEYSPVSIQEFIRAGGDIHAIDRQGNHILLKKVYDEYAYDRIGWFYEEGNEEPDGDGLTESEHVRKDIDSMIAAMIDLGVSVNVQNKAGDTPLMISAHSEALIKAGADVHATDAQGRTVLMRAVSTIDWDASVMADYKSIIRAGADVNAVIPNDDGYAHVENPGYTALMLLIKRYELLASELSYNEGDYTNENERDKLYLPFFSVPQLNILNDALEVQDPSFFKKAVLTAVKELIVAGADVTIKAADGMTALSLTKDPDILALLHKK